MTADELDAVIDGLFDDITAAFDAAIDGATEIGGGDYEAMRGLEEAIRAAFAPYLSTFALAERVTYIEQHLATVVERSAASDFGLGERSRNVRNAKHKAAVAWARRTRKGG